MWDEIRSWRPDVSDDECITLAVLHGAIIQPNSSLTSDLCNWLVWLQGESMPIRGQGGAGGVTKGDACRRYVKRHNLLG